VSSGIGFLALFGVSVQTAVVYISYVNELRLGGTPLAEAIREGAILRLRPIMMTALVAAMGLLPVALATGVGTDSQRPFALVIVSAFGVGTSIYALRHSRAFKSLAERIGLDYFAVDCAEGLKSFAERRDPQFKGF